MTLEMTEKQRHRGLREMAEEFTMPHPIKDIDDRYSRINELEHKIAELEGTLDIVNQQRISAEATRFAALHILEDIVQNTVYDISEDIHIVPQETLNRAKAMVANHRGSGELPR